MFRLGAATREQQQRAPHVSLSRFPSLRKYQAGTERASTYRSLNNGSMERSRPGVTGPIEREHLYVLGDIVRALATCERILAAFP